MKKLKIWMIDGSEEIVESANVTEVKNGILYAHLKIPNETIEHSRYGPYRLKFLVAYPLTSIKKWSWIDE